MAEADYMSRGGTDLLVPGSSHKVQVTHIYDPKNFYVRLKTHSDVVPSLEIPGDLIKNKNALAGKRIVFKSQKLDKYVRGDIINKSLEANEARCTILAIDYGYKENSVSTKCIYLPKDEEKALEWPPLALFCQLDKCEPVRNEFVGAATDAMKFIMREGTVTMKIISKTTEQKFIVQLESSKYEYADYKDVTTALKLLGFASKARRPSIPFEDALTFEPLRYMFKHVSLDAMFYVRTQSGTNFNSFYVADLNDFNRLLIEGRSMEKYCKTQPSIQDVAAAADDGRCCAVIVNKSKYERATVLKVTVPGTMALVKLIDWGIEKEVHFSRIICMTSSAFTTLPAIAMHCTAIMSQEEQDTLQAFLLPGCQYTMKVLHVAKKTDMPHTVRILYRSNLDTEI